MDRTVADREDRIDAATSQIAEVLSGGADSISSERVPLPPNALQRIIAATPIPWWSVALGLPVSIATLGILAVSVDSTLGDVEFDDWRIGLLGPVVTLLLLLAEPAMRMLRDRSVVAIRAVTELSIVEYQEWLDRSAPRCTGRGQLIAFGIGAVATVALFAPWSAVERQQWSNLYGILSLALLFSATSWLVYTAFINTRLFSAIFSQLAKPDPLHPDSLYPVGRWSLSFSTFLVICVGASVIFLPTSSLISYQTGIINSVMILAAVAVFFLGSSSAHSAMSRARQDLLEVARLRSSVAMELLRTDDTEDSAAKATAWMMYERRVVESPSWPFNTAMVRRLAISIAVPGAAALARVLPGYVG